MQKPLLLSLTALAVLGVTTATTLYAQTVTGNTIIAKMKAAVANFTLTSDLNPGETGLQSAPIKGKKTGDVLTAGEWNRVLELVSEGGGGGTGAVWENVPLEGTENFDDSCLYRFQIQNPGRQPYVGTMPYFFPNAVSPTQLTWWLGTFSPEEIWHIAASSKSVLRMNGTAYTAGGNITKIEKLCGGGGSAGGGITLYKCTNAQSLDSANAPCYGASRNGGAGTDKYRVVSCTDNDGVRSYTMSSILNFGQLVTNKWAVSVNGGTIECDDGTVLVMDIQGGGSSGGATSSWENVPLTDTADFDPNCDYRIKGDWKSSLTESSKDDWLYNPIRVGKNVIMWDNAMVIKAATKNILWWSWSSNDSYANVTDAWGRRITKIEKLCGGGGASGSSNQTNTGLSSRAKAVRASGHALNIPTGITDWPNTIVCDGYGGWAGGTQILSLDFTGNNVIGYTQSEGVGVYFNTSTGVLAQADRVHVTCGASAGNIATICAEGRCVD